MLSMQNSLPCTSFVGGGFVLFFPRSHKSVFTAFFRTPLSSRDRSSPAAPSVHAVLRGWRLHFSMCDSAVPAAEPESLSPSKRWLELYLEASIWPSSHRALPMGRVKSWPALPEEQEVALVRQDEVTQAIHYNSFPVNQVVRIGIGNTNYDLWCYVNERWILWKESSWIFSKEPDDQMRFKKKKKKHPFTS